jgi:hypothetical protein
MSKVKELLKGVIRDEVIKVATDPKTDMSRKDVTDVVNAIEPVIAHATNNEPWYQSRVTWGSIAAVIFAVLTGLGFVVDVQTWTQVLVVSGPPIAAALYQLYGRWYATKPIAA